MVDFLFRSNNISDWMSQIEVLFAAIFFIFVVVMLAVSKEKNKQQMYLYGIFNRY